MSPEQNDPKDAPGASADEVGRGDERSEAVEGTAEKPKPKRKTTEKKPAATPAEVEKEVSEEAGKSIPRPSGDDETPAPAEESSEPAAVEASVAEEKTQQPAKKRRKKADDAPKGEEKAADDKPAKARPTRKRDQPRKREPGEAPVLVSAKARYVRTSARKARLVCDHIRGKDVEQARAILSFTPRGAAKPWMKLLESAIANAEHNHELVGDELKIASVHADEGPTLKRYRPRAMGRATRIRKRTSHLSITLTPKE
jgi:ribosomal protein L22